MMENNLQSIMNHVIQLFNPEKAAGIDAAIQFFISGDEGGEWFAIIRNKELSVSQGTIPNPKLTLKANSMDIVNMFNGKLNPMQAYMQGKIQAQGDLGLAMRMAEVFRPSTA
jgi:putative sterol carrier protein